MTDASIRLKAIDKSYNSNDQKKPILKQFSRDFYPNKVTSISGPSGSGKTTLLSLIGLLDHFDSGKMEVLGSDVEALNTKERQRLRKRTFSYVFQRSGLINDMTIYQNLILPLVYSERKTIPHKEDLENILANFDLHLNLKRIAASLSGGERIRLAFARAILLSHPIVICDEPTASLDDKNTKIIGEKLKNLARSGKTVIIATHDHRLNAFVDDFIKVKNAS